MNHNVNGYYGDQNPLKIDGKYDPVATGAIQRGGLNRRKQSLAAAGIAESIDPTRVVYNHESGNMGPIHCTNTYLNWAPIQERSDWLEHWANVGVKPLFLRRVWAAAHLLVVEFSWPAIHLEESGFSVRLGLGVRGALRRSARL